ncbi:MAG: hypothetical protein AB1896_13260 [Thermodesulfobacteriota bacterium]
MKAAAVLLAVVFLLAPVGVALAAGFPNEPPGFRGIRWGTPLDEIKGKMTLYRIDFNDPKGYVAETHPSDDPGLDQVGRTGELADYEREDDSLRLGRAEVQSIAYGFYQDRFFRVLVRYKEVWNYEYLKEMLFDLYGPVKEQEGEYRCYWWYGREVTVGLKYEVFNRGGTVVWTYNPIVDRMKQDFVEEARTGGEGF